LGKEKQLEVSELKIPPTHSTLPPPLSSNTLTDTSSSAPPAGDELNRNPQIPDEHKLTQKQIRAIYNSFKGKKRKEKGKKLLLLIKRKNLIGLTSTEEGEGRIIYYCFDNEIGSSLRELIEFVVSPLGKKKEQLKRPYDLKLFVQILRYLSVTSRKKNYFGRGVKKFVFENF
jgi:hypothetical protein